MFTEFVRVKIAELKDKLLFDDLGNVGNANCHFVGRMDREVKMARN